MLSQRSRLSPQTPLSAARFNNEQSPTQKNDTISDYERTREDRIKQNLEKMQKLGIFDLSLKVNSGIHQTRSPKSQTRVKSSPSTPPLQPSGPSRRSSRLKGSTPVNYSEVDSAKKDKALGDVYILTEKGSMTEIYTEEHEKLLGHTEKSWTLFVDGIGRDGKRIYDQVNGKTCHQCRQKTLGHRTHCSECNKVQGQFCGDCLYMRYGEHVIEANENPNWICPVCREICNCSLCRQAKGWAPTGTLYRKISQLGYKSVAHYLIQTRRIEANLGIKENARNEEPVKRSLPFSDVNAVPNEVNNDQIESSEQFSDKSNDKFSVKRSLPFSNSELASENVGSLEVVDHIGCSNHQYPIKREVDFRSEKEKECSNSDAAQATLSSVENIGGNLMQMCEKSEDHDEDLPKKVYQENDVEFACSKHKDVEKTLYVGTSLLKDIYQGSFNNEDHDVEFACSKHKDVEKTLYVGASLLKDIYLAGILKQRHEEICDRDDEKKANVMQTVVGISLPSDIKQHGGGSAPLETSRKLKRKRALAVEASPDSIAGRLRQRRRMNNGHDDDGVGLAEKKNG